MADAILLLRTIYISFMNWIFSIEIDSGVSFGWFLLAIIVIRVLLQTLIVNYRGSGGVSDE